METVKVDIRKLQLLNDRINQCIDALHQVRLSVHALQQTQQTQQPYGAGFGTQTFGGFPQNMLQMNPFVGQGYHPLLQQLLQQQQQPFGQSLGQTFGQGYHPLLQQLQQQQQPFGQGFGQNLGQNFPLLTQGQTGFGQTQPGLLHSNFPWSGTQGLSHTGMEPDFYNQPLWSNPILAARVATTFPYAHYSVPPVVTLF